MRAGARDIPDKSQPPNCTPSPCSNPSRAYPGQSCRNVADALLYLKKSEKKQERQSQTREEECKQTIKDLPAKWTRVGRRHARQAKREGGVAKAGSGSSPVVKPRRTDTEDHTEHHHRATLLSSHTITYLDPPTRMRLWCSARSGVSLVSTMPHCQHPCAKQTA